MRKKSLFQIWGIEKRHQKMMPGNKALMETVMGFKLRHNGSNDVEEKNLRTFYPRFCKRLQELPDFCDHLNQSI